ncbi:hypothetical protein [Brevibacillus laterosporus]|uniref:Uncharacterized protein n=1 Tax=Brevibacillus laterosporus TaxID=1465 RepID=A0AAP3DFB0_BRELA|nr:hypothetical protein [Brevibacillus laterosporus]MCR8979437.1 hypothetical protein [Brevibacillus laterosporus]MCZ0806592.1 hypothetical protein [Brevibacillus laterosporus]MCZ0825040.1 hypothetical protein [Brevibacillus laterosporus]MCZ0849903.1 hypothetical protein [Brevibacillus laterosporus]
MNIKDQKYKRATKIKAVKRWTTSIAAVLIVAGTTGMWKGQELFSAKYRFSYDREGAV